VVRPAPSTVRLSSVRVRDPAGGLPWTVRVGAAGDGTRCVTVGQVRGRRLGIQTRDGGFRPLGPAADGQCGQVVDGGAGADAPLVGLRDVARVTGRRVRATVVFGMAAPGATSVRVLMPNGRVRRAELAPDGSFVAIVPGEPRQAQPIVDVREGSAGVHVSFQLGRTLPDPEAAGRPWTLRAGGAGQRVVDGRPVGPVPPTCFGLHPVAPFVGADTRMPAVCGARAGRWATVTPLRTGARGRFVVGREPRRVEWSGLPSRTLVAIRSPGLRGLVTLRARGRTWAVRRVGTESVGRRGGDTISMGLLPGIVRPEDVVVTLQRGAGRPAALPVEEVALQDDRGERR
jgi:hypothetical protein